MGVKDLKIVTETTNYFRRFKMKEYCRLIGRRGVKTAKGD
jgi:hypothetical protein